VGNEVNSIQIMNPESVERDDFYSLLLHFKPFVEEIWSVVVADVTFSREMDSSRGYEAPQVCLYYWEPDKEMRDLAKSNKEWIKTYKVAEDLPTYETVSGNINRLVLRLPSGADQDNVPMLFEYVSKSIKEIPDEKILDIVYRKHLDRDAIEHPFIVVYYES